jgi:hypothetical protein
MAKIKISPRSFLIPLLGLLAVACSSSDDRSQVVVDLQLGVGVSAPQTVHVSVTQGGVEVKAIDHTWDNASSPNQIGLFFPSQISGQVTIAATAYTNSAPVAQGQVATPVALSESESVGPYPLVLNGLRTSDNDGGVVDSGATDTGAAGTEVGDAGQPNPHSDADPEAGVADAAFDGATGDTVSQADVPITNEDAQDAPVTDALDGAADSADATGEVGLAWEPTANIQNDPAATCYTPVVTVDPVNEHVYVAWNEEINIRVKRWNRQTAAWGKAITLDDRGSPHSPAISADAKGNVMVLWAQDTNGVNSSLDGVWMARTTDGTTWSPPVRIVSAPAWEVVFALARNGTGHAAYSKKSGSNWPLHTAYYDGTAWTENATAVQAEAYSADSEPQIALSALGDGLLIFSKSWGVAGTVLTANTFTTPIMLDPNYQTVSAYNPTISVNRKGEGIVVWTESSGSNTIALARAYNPATGWSSPTPPLVTASTVATPAVVLDEQSVVTLVWQQDTKSGGANMMGKRGTLAGTWSEPTILETDNRAGHSGLVTDYAYPKAAIDGSGNVLIVWRKDLTEGTTSTYGLYATRYASGTWLPQVKLGQKTGFDVPVYSLAVADSGLAAVTFKYTNATATTTDPDSDSTLAALFR